MQSIVVDKYGDGTLGGKQVRSMLKGVENRRFTAFPFNMRGIHRGMNGNNGHSESLAAKTFVTLTSAGRTLQGGDTATKGDNLATSQAPSAVLRCWGAGRNSNVITFSQG